MREQKEYLNTKETQEFLGIKRSFFYALRRQKDFPAAIKLSQNSVRYKHSDLVTWLESKKVSKAN